MDKVSILTASRLEPSILPYSTEILVNSLSPIVRSILQLQRVLSTLSLQLLFRAYTAACITLATALWSSRLLAVHAWLVAKGGVGISRHIVWWTWTSKAVVALREQTFNSFATWILGSGNGFILMLFWPGWWFLAGATCAIWMVCG